MTDDAPPTAGRPLTYTAWLRNLPDSGLAALFAARPDLITPVPADFGALAARASTKPAVLRVLDRLDRFSLRVLEALVALGDDRLSTPGPHGGATGDGLATALDAPEDAVRRSLDLLIGTALVWTDGPLLRPVTVLREILPQPLGLGPPLRVLLGGRPAVLLDRLAADLGLPALRNGDAPGDPAERVADALGRADLLDSLLAEAGPQARPVLDRLTWGPPNGSVSGAGREVDTASATSPIDRLLARGLLVAAGDDTVALPREIALHLRGGRLTEPGAPAESAPPPLDGARHSPASVLRVAAGQAFTVVRGVEELLESWAAEPPGVLRNGGLGVRDLRAAAVALDVDDPTAAVLIEAAYAAGLLAASDDLAGEWLPTAGYDVWRRAEPARRWTLLAAAWLRSPRVAALSGSKDARGRARNVLGEGLDRRAAPDVRADVLTALATAPEGTAPTAESVAARLAWLRPRRQGAAYTALVDSALREAGVLGLTGRGALTPYARALLAESGGDTEPAADSAAAGLLAPEMPRPIDHIMVQGDLTAVAPGPLVRELAAELALAADIESTGGATVYRFTEGSVRRALDAGRGAEELVALLERHSTTPLPQALRYLVADVARRHGRLRVGTASSYLRCDDAALLTELAGDRRAADLALFRLAPTVLASRSTRPVLLERLAELGYHPVAEAVDGSVQLHRPESRRADGRPRSRDLTEPAPPGPELRTAAVRAVRAGDEAMTAERRPVEAPGADPPRSPMGRTLAALSAAAAQGRRVWIGYLDADGRASSRIVDPARVDGGFLTAYDATRAAVSRFAIHRITGVADIEAAEPAESAQRPEPGIGPTRQPAG